MEQEVARWLLTQLDYNSSADSTLSSNCRGNLKGLWEFVITNYKTADSKRHIQHVLAKHRREQEAARRAPEQQREAEARFQRLHQLRKKNAELEKKLSSVMARTETRVQEATEQVCEQSLMQHALQETRAQTLLLQAFVYRGQQLLPELQARLAQLQYTLDTVKIRCRHAGGSKVQQSVQQQLASLSSNIKKGLHQTLWKVVQQQGLPLAGADLQQQTDQQQTPDTNRQLAASGLVSINGSSSINGSISQQQGAADSTTAGLQQLLRLCKLLQGYKVPPEVLTSALQLLQHPPSLVWDTCTQLAHQNLLELTARINEAEREMLAPLAWPGGNVSTSMQQVLLLHKPDQQQQQLALYGDCASKHKLPWASGLSLPSAVALQEAGISPPPEIRIKLRLKDHLQLHIQTEQALQRAQAAQRELHMLLGSTPLLQAGPAAEDGSVVSWEAELAQVYLSLVRARAQVQLLQQYRQQVELELLELKQIQGITEEKRQAVQQQMNQDHELNLLLHLAAADTMDLEASLRGQQQQLAQLLSLQLLPCGTAATDASQGAVGQQQREMAAVEKLPLLDLTQPVRITAPPEKSDCSSGSSSLSNPVLSKTTLARLQSAGRQFLLAGRATTGPKPFRGAAAAGTGAGATFAGHDVLAVVGASDASRRFGDSAAVAALKEAVQLDPAAPLRCPAALLLNVADQCQEASQLQQQVASLFSTSTEVAATTNAAVHQEEQLQEKVDLLHLHERQEVLPKLQALLEEGHAARAFAREELMTNQKQMWEMPAMHLVPHRTYRGKDCSGWLRELQVLHAQRREIEGHASHAHKA